MKNKLYAISFGCIILSSPLFAMKKNNNKSTRPLILKNKNIINLVCKTCNTKFFTIDGLHTHLIAKNHRIRSCKYCNSPNLPHKIFIKHMENKHRDKL